MRAIVLVFVVALFAVSKGAAYGQSGAQAGSSASTNASIQAGKSGAQASSNNSASTSARTGQNSAYVANGTTMNAALSQPLDAKRNRPGDPVAARTTEAVKSDGKVVIPKGSKLIGHVTEAKARSKGESESALGVMFDKAILKDGREIPVSMTIQALAAAQAAASSSLEDDDLGLTGGGRVVGSGRAAGRGALGGATSTVGGAVGAVTNTTSNVGNVAGGAVDSTVNQGGAAKGAVGGLSAAGELTSNSHGAFGLNGIDLKSTVSNNTQGSIITSTSKNVHLDNGTRLLLVSQSQAQATESGR